MSATETAASTEAPRSQRRGNHHGRFRQPRNTAGNTSGDVTETSGGETAAPTRRRNRGPRNSALALRPASVAPKRNNQPSTDTPVAVAEGPSTSATETQPNQSRNARKPKQPQPTRMINGRQFGGKLTSQSHDAGEAAGQLQAEAVEFFPGQPLLPTQVTQGGPIKRRRPSKSIAADILTRTHEDIEYGNYECAICTSEVERRSKVWSCRTCWTVFHLSCIKKWASNEGSAAARRQSLENGDKPPPRQWRCPGCNLPKDEQPKTYHCWCGKETEPRPPTGIPPHSCGNTCSKERVRKCPHPCQLTCHAGPCPPCTYMGPSQSCFCGKNEITRKCAETDYENGWSCEEPCGDVMPCGIHTCPRPCHEGLCGACEVTVDATCYCGQVKQLISCHAQKDPKESQRKDSLEPGSDISSWMGTFACDKPCDRTFDCAIHHCEKACHPQVAIPPHCPRSPDSVLDCPCGKTPLSELLDQPRKSCTEPIPNCGKPCARPLDCGHLCRQTCHSGECLPCMQTAEIPCVCGRTTSQSICHQGSVEKPQCMRVCRTTLSCGRHACDERCCSGEKTAAERQSTKKQRRPLGAPAPRSQDLIEAEHICTRVCGRPLKCGNHTCQELCHKGACGSCREAIFEEILCDCGRTRLDPPLPCGTRPPPCRFQCERPKACGHPQVQHNCHPGDEACPKCPFLVERRCMCGKKSLKNQQCWLQDVRCGQICGRKLKCGSHFCRKQCHKPGECEDSDGRPCQQACGKPKKACEHPDENACHAPFPCKEDKPCNSKIFITCECQAQKQEARCGASRSSEGNLSKKLPCTDECARLERNRRLAVALNIDQSEHKDGLDHIPYAEDTLSLYAQHPQWCQNQEREFRVFADSPDEKRLRFKPMPPSQRAFLHALAEDFGFDSESMDPEPHRHVLLLKTPRFVSAPSKTLGESLRIRTSQRALQIRQPVQDKISSTNQQSSAPFNAFLITAPRFALTTEEVKTALAASDPPVTENFDISFLPSEEVVLRPTTASTDALQTEARLKALKAALAASITSNAIGTIHLCAIDGSLNVLRREVDGDGAGFDGWSRVAAKAAAPRRNLGSVTTARPANSFSALSGANPSTGKVTFAKKKEIKKKPVAEPEVADSWEQEMEDRPASEQQGSAEGNKEQDLGQVGEDGLAGSDVQEVSA